MRVLVQPQPHIFARPSKDPVALSLVLVTVHVRLWETYAVLDSHLSQLGAPPLSQ